MPVVPTQDDTTAGTGRARVHDAKKAGDNNAPLDATLLQTMLSKRSDEIIWLRTTGGAKLRRVRHILKVPSHLNGDCLHKLTKGHQSTTAAWLGLTIGVTRKMLTNPTESDSEEHQKRVDAYLRQLNPDEKH